MPGSYFFNDFFMIRKFLAVLALVLSQAVASTHAAVITAVPGPDDQGGMIMPMVTVMGNTLDLMFMPGDVPVLSSLQTWSPGDTFQPTAAWYAELDPAGGNGKLFNNQYGFMGMVMDPLPDGKELAIKLTGVSSPDLQFWNYSNNLNLFDEVFTEVGSQVLWDGTMWHNYATLPANAAPGTYTATFEVFVANGTFTEGTGFVDYTTGAQAATRDTNYNSVVVNYTWTVVPEPGASLMAGAGVLVLLTLRRRKGVA